MAHVVPDLLRRSAALVPDRPAVILDGQDTLTFAELEARSNAFARACSSGGSVTGTGLPWSTAAPTGPATRWRTSACSRSVPWPC